MISLKFTNKNPHILSIFLIFRPFNGFQGLSTSTTTGLAVGSGVGEGLNVADGLNSSVSSSSVSVHENVCVGANVSELVNGADAVNGIVGSNTSVGSAVGVGVQFLGRDRVGVGIAIIVLLCDLVGNGVAERVGVGTNHKTFSRVVGAGVAVGSGVAVSQTHGVSSGSSVVGDGDGVAEGVGGINICSARSFAFFSFSNCSSLCFTSSFSNSIIRFLSSASSGSSVSV